MWNFSGHFANTVVMDASLLSPSRDINHLMQIGDWQVLYIIPVAWACGNRRVFATGQWHANHLTPLAFYLILSCGYSLKYGSSAVMVHYNWTYVCLKKYKHSLVGINRIQVSKYPISGLQNLKKVKNINIHSAKQHYFPATDPSPVEGAALQFSPSSWLPALLWCH